MMADLIREEKILHWGISEATEEYLRRAHKVCPVAAVQNRYSMMARKHEVLFPVLEELFLVPSALTSRPIMSLNMSIRLSASSRNSSERICKISESFRSLCEGRKFVYSWLIRLMTRLWKSRKT